MANSANPEINKKIATSALGTLVIATVFFYLGDRYAETLVTYPGQIFDHLSDAFLSMWQTIKDLLCYEPLFEPSLHGKRRERVGKRTVRPARPLVSDVVGGIHQLVAPSHEPREQFHGVRDACVLPRAHPDGG